MVGVNPLYEKHVDCIPDIGTLIPKDVYDLFAFTGKAIYVSCAVFGSDYTVSHFYVAFFSSATCRDHFVCPSVCLVVTLYDSHTLSGSYTLLSILLQTRYVFLEHSSK